MVRRDSFMRVAMLALLFTSSLKSEDGISVYRSLARFDLSGGAVRADSLTIQRDRVKMTFNGIFYLETPISGHVRGAVFFGKGTFSAEAPPVEFELDNLRRMLKSDRVESDFQIAVLRFSDDTDSEFSAASKQDPAPEDAQRVGHQWSNQLLRETGANVPARVALSILNNEKPGFFCATFDKGHLGRFTFLLDQQGRLPGAIFGINAGESGLIFSA